MSALAAVCDGLAGCWLDPHKAQGARDPRRCLFYSAPKLIVDKKKSFPWGNRAKLWELEPWRALTEGLWQAKKMVEEMKADPERNQQLETPETAFLKLT